MLTLVLKTCLFHEKCFISFWFDKRVPVQIVLAAFVDVDVELVEMMQVGGARRLQLLVVVALVRENSYAINVLSVCEEVQRSEELVRGLEWVWLQLKV